MPTTTAKAPAKKKTPAGPTGRSERVFPPEHKQAIEHPKKEQTASKEPEVQYLKWELFVRSPWNREVRNPEKFGELVESIKRHGIIQPIIARLCTGKGPDVGLQYEIVAGEGRWLGAQSAGLNIVPAIIRRLNDCEALEIQAIENLNREDLNPMDEARKYRQLLDTPNYKMERLCEVTGKKKSAIYERLKLLSLPPEAMAAVESGKLPASHAALIAKLEILESYREIVKAVLNPGKYQDAENGVLSFRATKQLVDEKLKEEAKQMEWLKLKAEFERDGLPVLTEKESREVFQWGSQVKTGSDFATLDTWCYETAEDENKQWSKLIPDPTKLLATLALSLHGDPVLLYSVHALKAAAMAAGIKFRSASLEKQSSSQNDHEYVQRQEILAKRVQVFERVQAQIIGDVCSGRHEGPFLGLAARAYYADDFCNGEGSIDLARASGIVIVENEEDLGDETVIREALKCANMVRIREFIARSALQEFRPQIWHTEIDPGLFDLCKDWGTPLQEIIDEVMEPPAAKEPAPKRARAKK